MNKQGTAWTDRKQGATLADLLKAAGQETKPGDEKILTDLSLTGSPLNDYDVRRIKLCKQDRIS